MAKKRLLEEYLNQQDENNLGPRFDFKFGRLKKTENIRIIIPKIDHNDTENYFEGNWNTDKDSTCHKCKLKLSPKNDDKKIEFKFKFNSCPKEYVETYSLPKEFINLEPERKYYDTSKNIFGKFIFCLQIININRGWRTIQINKKYDLEQKKQRKPKKNVQK